VSAAVAELAQPSLGVIHVISISGGKDSQATALEAKRKFPHARIIGITCDTDNEHPLTYEHIAYLRRALGIEIHVLKADFTERMAVKREFIARDQRTRRQYEKVPKRDKAGNIVYRRDNAGLPELVQVWKKDGTFDLEGVPKLVKRHGRKVRWSNKAKRRALPVLYPTGNAFLDLCLWKGRFPSRKAQFCTEELKTLLAVEFQLDLVEQGYTVVSWQGVRRDESANRRNAKKFERIGPRMFIYRPIVEWTAMDTIRFTQKAGVASNPLYSLGMSRVGCFCINQGKDEIRQWAVRWPWKIDEIADWEWKVGQASKRGFSTFFADAPAAVAQLSDRRAIYAELNVRERVRWAFTTRGGRQFDILGGLDESEACSSSLGLCG
jgi:3'-phosphoadenosine 5'-phosphosulfate sulfotransferase (PAPS reductase)/FAD synthetase